MSCFDVFDGKNRVQMHQKARLLRNKLVLVLYAKVDQRCFSVPHAPYAIFASYKKDFCHSFYFLKVQNTSEIHT
jgi:hypothetical protein